VRFKMPVYVFAEPETSSLQTQDVVECLKGVDSSLKVDNPDDVSPLQLIELVEQTLRKVANFKGNDIVLHSVLVIITSTTNKPQFEAAINNFVATLTVRCETMDAIQLSMRLKLLTNMLVKIPFEESALFTKTFTSIFEWASKHKLLAGFPSTADQIHDFIKEWNLKPEEKVALWRTVIPIYRTLGNKERVRECLVELLTCLPKEMAAASKQEATECIVAHFSDPLVYNFDALAQLRPIQMLEGEPIHNLLTIFIRGSLDDYNAFAKEHSGVFDKVGLNRDVTIAKLRVLSFLQMAEGKSELGYDAVAKQVGIDIAKVEQFLFDVVRTNLTRLRLDQANKRVRILSVSWSRSVGSGIEQWQEIQKQLGLLNQQLAGLQQHLEDVTTAKQDQMEAVVVNAATAISSRM